MFNANTSDIKEGRKIPDYARRFSQERLVTQYFTSQIVVLSIKMLMLRIEFVYSYLSVYTFYTYIVFYLN